jgi:hypothetical protein
MTMVMLMMTTRLRMSTAELYGFGELALGSRAC